MFALLAIWACAGDQPEPRDRPPLGGDGPADTGWHAPPCEVHEFLNAEEHCQPRVIPGPASDGVELVRRRPFSYAWAGWDVATFKLTEAHALGLRTVHDEPPRFHLLGPPNPDPAQPYTVLLNLHGGAADDDAYVEDGFLGRCTRGQAAEIAEGGLQDRAVFQVAVELGWLVLVPENPACDAWVGQGADDPMDPRHGGHALAEAALAFLAEGRADIQVERVIVAGQSLGVIGAVWFASHDPTVEGLLIDSGPTDLMRYVMEEDYSPEGLSPRRRVWGHLLGALPIDEAGQPTPTWPRYAQGSLLHAAEDGLLTGRVAHLWSQHDHLSVAAQHVDVEQALVAAGIELLEYDADHSAPAHVQTGSLASLYASMAALRHLDGQEVWLVEAEDAPVADAGGLDGEVTSASRGQVRRLPEGREGEALNLALGQVPAGAAGAVTLFLRAQTEGLAEDDEVLTLRLADDSGVLAERALSAGQLGPLTADRYGTLRDGLEATTLQASAASGPLRLEVETTGAAALDLDVALVSYQSPQ
ncbi:MAG: hypothetical protein H6740_13290 [Alphaproteobacteria bacterium]|nr:hypothetical protein [Alphaproteobacteria bacterium]